ncbi:MAG: 6-phosphogluconolactonase [Candidatus Hodarchaeales archaeon]
MTISRRIEIRNIMKLSSEDVINRAKDKLIVCNDLKEMHEYFAEDIATYLRKSSENEKMNIILPIGPTGQYPILAEIINKEKLDLTNVQLFFMDEYCNELGKALPEDHPLSFKRTFKEQFIKHLKNPSILDKTKIIFPDENNIKKLVKIVKDIDVCFGGIGIHGHIAFNEPETDVAFTNPRKVRLNDFTITINCIRSNVGGNLENFPKEAFTLGMKQILNSKKVRLYCRSGCFDWAKTILRIALFCKPGDDYPVTHLRNETYSTDWTIITDQQTLQGPKYLI